MSGELNQNKYLEYRRHLQKRDGRSVCSSLESKSSLIKSRERHGETPKILDSSKSPCYFKCPHHPGLPFQREANLLKFLCRKSLTASANPEYNSSSISFPYEDSQPAMLQFPHAMYDHILCNNGIWWIGLGQYVTQEL